MTVEVRLFATLAQFLPPGSHDGSAVLDVPEAATIDLVTRHLLAGVRDEFHRYLLALDGGGDGKRPTTSV